MGSHALGVARPNRAFENGRADKHRAFGLRPWRRAAQRGRYASVGPMLWIQ